MSRVRYLSNPDPVDPTWPVDGLSYLPPAQRQVLREWAEEYRTLVAYVDARYERGDLDSAPPIEDLEARAQQLLELIDATLSELETGEGDGTGPHGDDEHEVSGGVEADLHGSEQTVGLEESLASYWEDFIRGDRWGDRFSVIPHHDHPQGIFTREQKLVLMIRHDAAWRIWLHGGESSRGMGPPEHAEEYATWDRPAQPEVVIAQLPDAALLAAARDAYERREALRARYRAKPKNENRARDLEFRARLRKGLWET